MTQKVKTTATAKKFQVFVGEELKAESNIHSDVLPTIIELQKENVPEFKVVYHQQKISELYFRDSNNKNYFVKNLDYVAPSQAVAEEEATD